ncbi:MAG: decarboxylating 6-phosphogluconate dehydrogenase [Candidatus Saccharimonadales bacterium]
MKIGFSGLGRMGGNMVARLIENGQQVVVMNRSPEPVQAAVKLGAQSATNYRTLVSQLDPVVVWLMLPESVTDAHFNQVLPLMPEGSVLIDGGNSNFNRSVERAKVAHEKNTYFVDIGTSGGILGREAGYAMMVGGDEKAVKIIKPILDALAPVDGWAHFGPAGSGHYVKMVHNAIEYGMMESYAEGYRMLKEGPFKDMDLAQVGQVWQHGSIVQSLLNELARQALAENPDMKGIDGVVAESGEARWALETAKTLGIDMPSVQASFDVRLSSQKGEITFATKLLAAIRNKFGGHEINPSV